MFNNHDSAIKQEIREKVLSMHSNPKQVLSLPSTNFIFEKMVLGKYPNCNVICAEKKSSLYSTCIWNKPEGVSLYYGDIFDVELSSIVDIAWFDLCGSLTPDVQRNIIDYVQSPWFTKDCVMCLTVLYSRMPSDIFIKKHYGVDRDVYFREYFPKLVRQQAWAVGKDLSYEIMSYTDSSPMQLFIFKNIQREKKVHSMDSQ